MSVANLEQSVKQRYGDGAQQREADLCCPIDYDPKYLAAIPADRNLSDLRREERHALMAHFFFCRLPVTGFRFPDSSIVIDDLDFIIRVDAQALFHVQDHLFR